MSERRKKNLNNLKSTRLIKGLLSLATKGYFEETGWNLSYIHKESLAPDGNPIPWLTYSLLDFLSGRIHENMTLFEYGSGNSTIYFSKLVKEIDAVEDNKEWLEKVAAKVPENVNLIYQSLEGTAYENTILNQEKSYDLVIVDGRKRVKCLKTAVEKIKNDGVLLLDDAEREKYAEAFVFMKEKGFKYIPFSGIAIGAIHAKNTTVFYKDDNCLGI